MKFDYASAFASDSPEAYEHLLADAFRGDATLFIRSDETNAAWRVIDAIRDGWADDVDGGVERYAPGSWGPEKAERIFDDPYVRWLN
jgi:glucose-6-phosphate 1-dehydrogenase